MLLFKFINNDMSDTIKWTCGLQGYKKCTLELGEGSNKFTTEILDVPFEKNRSITEIFNYHLSNRNTKYVEVLYSGGLDSEIILLHCLKNNIPVIAITMVIRVNGLLINTHDLYYAEKFCREHNINHKFIELNAKHFFDNGLHYDYISPYYITEPHVATHFWLTEQCSYFPVFGGDWLWAQTHTEKRVISPARLEFSSYERFMNDKNISGIGNMIGHSLESSIKFMQLQLDNDDNVNDVSTLKGKMYRSIEPTVEPRLRSYGWERHSTKAFNMNVYKLDLIKRIKLTKPFIKWNDSIKQVLNTTETQNDKF